MKILIDGQTLATYEMKRGIGRVFLSLVNQLVNEYDHINWYIAVPEIEALTHFYPSVQAKLTPLLINLPQHADPTSDGELYQNSLQTIIDDHQIQIYWNMNPLMLNVFFPYSLENVDMHVMIHDLIPKVLGYTEQWPKEHCAEYLRRLTLIAQEAKKIVAISKATAVDLTQYFPNAKNQCEIIYHGINHLQFYPRPVKIPLYGLPYILYVGGFDPRKNMSTALTAFSYVCHQFNVDERLQFYIVCDATPQQIKAFYQEAAQLNISTRVKLLYQVNQAELSELYAHAELFFFPSLYEGFGLPLLEAMASGTLTLASDLSVAREIGENTILYCHPTHIEQMAKQLYQALNLDLTKKKRQIQQAIQRAASFCWEQSAEQYLKTFKSKKLHYPLTDIQKNVLKIAVATPWPPQASGVANYNYELLNYLSRYCQITLFNENPPSSSSSLSSDINQASVQRTNLFHQPLAQLSKTIHQFDFVLYQLGNNVSYHREIYKLAWTYPSIIVLHDFYLYQFMAIAFSKTSDNELHKIAQQASLQYQTNYLRQLPSKELPCCEAIVERSKATVVHNTWVRQQLHAFNNVHLIHHGAKVNTDLLTLDEQKQLKEQFGIDSADYIIATFGFVNFTKRIPSVIQAVAELYYKKYPVKLLIVGEIDKRQIDIQQICEDLALPDHLIIKTDYVNDYLFTQLMKLCDIFVGLRQPSMGETSGPLMKALGMGKPCVVSNYQQFTHLPDDICFKILTDDREIPHLVACLEALIQQPALRQKLGQNAQRYILKHASYEQCAQEYMRLFTELMN